MKKGGKLVKYQLPNNWHERKGKVEMEIFCLDAGTKWGSCGTLFSVLPE